MKILRFAISLLFTVGIMSCGGGDENKVDTTNPTIILNSPTSSVAINAGGILKVNAILSDNVKLEQYVVKINASSTKSFKNVEEFLFNSNSDTDSNGDALPVVAGEKTATLNFDIAIKENAQEGVYTFAISVKDQSGNEHEEAVQFQIVHS